MSEYKVGHISLKDNDLPDGWTIVEEDSWTLNLENDDYEGYIQIFFAGEPTNHSAYTLEALFAEADFDYGRDRPFKIDFIRDCIKRFEDACE